MCVLRSKLISSAGLLCSGCPVSAVGRLKEYSTRVVQ
jgi:hypothetical protein